MRNRVPRKLEIKKAKISEDHRPSEQMDDLLQFFQVDSHHESSAQKMEKYCIENADPDILLEELTEIKKDLGRLPENIDWRIPFRFFKEQNQDINEIGEDTDKTKLFDTILNDFKSQY